MIFDSHERLLHQLAETQRKVGVGDRMGVVSEVKQDGGEQKIRVVIGIDPDGKELVGPWMNTTDHRGATREQQQFKKGQNVRISGADGDYRQATVTPWSEGESFPQPDSAKDHGYGDSFQAGKLHTGKWMPEEQDQQQQGGQGGAQGGSQGSSGGQGEDKNHRHEVWIAKEDNKPPAYSGQSKVVQSSASGEAGSSTLPQQQQQAGQQQQKKPEAAIMVSTDEKNGYTARIGDGDSAVRIGVHEKGVKSRAGKDNYFASEKDKHSWFFAKEDNYVKAKDGNNYVNKPWVIKDPDPEKIPNDDKLGNKS